MEDVIRKLKRNGRKGELSDDDEEAAAAALYESAEECWDKIDAESAMISGAGRRARAEARSRHRARVA